MNEWSLFCANWWIQDGRIQDGCHHQVEREWMSFSQIELVWVRVLNKMVDSKMAELKMTEFKMAAIIKLSQNEWVRFFCAKWLNARWPNSRWLPSTSCLRMNEFESDWISLSFSFVQNGWMQDGRIQDGCLHQVQSEWMKEVSFVLIVGTNLGKCEWIWEEILWLLNARWWNWTWQNSRWLPSSS